jgi:hypothetical protein
MQWCRLTCDDGESAAFVVLPICEFALRRSVGQREGGYAPAVARRDHGKDITGLKYFHKPGDLLEQLHDVGCERDRADNRKLHMDEYCMLVLLYGSRPASAPKRNPATRNTRSAGAQCRLEPFT